MSKTQKVAGMGIGRSIFALGAVLSIGIALNGAGNTPRYIPMAHAEETPPNVGVPGAAPADNAALVFAPMAYFATNCARCHGPNGAFYGATFGKNLTDAQLHTVVHDMAAGPGNAPLADRALEAEVAYHRALIAKQPFIVVTEVTEKDGVKTLHGEVTPESTLTMTVGQIDVPVKLEEATWEATLPPQTDVTNITITATQGEVKTVLSLDTKLWSHAIEIEKK